ncbi:MAG TPA: dienelactone hydrolase family protein [Candidatus Angelobacter sp.]|nr:dienelactone hydrolase family protein [Candidatus Angelobacter sp.]
MRKVRLSIGTLVLTFTVSVAAKAQSSNKAETVTIQSGPITLHALLWRPTGRGPFPAVLLNHGSGRSKQELEKLGSYEDQAPILGPVFARHGYVFLYLFRRGVGLSADAGTAVVDLLDQEFAARGQAGRNALQLKLLEDGDLSDAQAGLVFLRKLPEVDRRKIAVIGHSFGGSLTLIQAEREPNLRAVLNFSGSGYSWERSPELRERLFAAVARIKAPVFFIHAENDYSLRPGKELDARLADLGKPHRLKIYPPIGKTLEDGHIFMYLGVSIWEPEVFAFLDEQMRRKR